MTDISKLAKISSVMKLKRDKLWLSGGDMTGDLTVDSPTFAVDTTNNRVGIGTATPERTLHIFDGDSGATSNAATTMIIEGSGASVFFSYLSPNTTPAVGFVMADPESAGAGQFIYDHPVDQFRIGIGGTIRHHWTAPELQAQQQFQISCISGPMEIASDAGDVILDASGDIHFDTVTGIGDGSNSSLVAPATGGGTGPTIAGTTTVLNDWIRAKKDDGTVVWIPCWS